MNKAIRVLALVMVMALAPPGRIAATTWLPRKVTCPLCGTVNTFSSVMSWGTYIYEWPSKYQYVFWPYTDENVAYSCKKCRLTCFMGDFAKVPAEKHDALRRALAGVTFSGQYGDYSKIPMSRRLEVAEKVYSTLGKDDRSWCHFYRVMGYHYGEESLPEKAAGSRRKALALARKMLQEQGNKGIAKELLLISGAMKRLLDDEAGALEDFRAAAELTYSDGRMKKAEAEAKDAYLSQLMGLFIDEMTWGTRVALLAGGAALLCVAAAGGIWYTLRRRR
jgi:hypothetical protein